MAERKSLIFIAVVTFLIGLLSGAALSHFLPISDRTINTITASQEPAPPPSGDSTLLLEAALETAQAIRSQDYDVLSGLIHPELGVTFSPSATVDLSSNLTFTPEQIKDAAGDSTTYVWGTTSDTVSPISLTLSDYFAAYVWDKNYLAEPHISVNTVHASGNALENAADAYPEGQFVEFYHPGSDNQSNWSALKLVYEWYSGDWYLVGVIHSGWSA